MRRLLAAAATAAGLVLATTAHAAEVYEEPKPIPGGEPIAAPPGAPTDDLRRLYNAASSLPEPMTWAMMIIGFGSAGAILRRRKALGEFD